MSLSHTEQAVAGAAVAVVLLAVLMIWTWRSRRALSRRLGAVVTRLERPGTQVDAGRGMERLLLRLERAADDNVLRMSEADSAAQRMRSALEHVTDGVMVWDDHGSVVFRNRSAAALLEQADGGALAAQALDEVRDGALAGESRTQGLDLFGPPRRTLVVTAAPIDDGWRTVGAVALVQDVSDRRRLEAVRRDFVANVSHELKTPVAALALLAGSLAGESDAAVARRLAGRLRDEAERVGAVLDELVDLNRVETEERPVREPVPVGLVVSQALERVRGLSGRAGVRVDVADVPAELAVMGDRSQLVAAVGHLLDNAVKYSQRGGAVSVAAATEGEGSWVVLTVRDQGIGIPGRDIDRVWERFYRSESGRKHAAGTGLGLSIVRHVAGSHGGSAAVESVEGQGSVFTLRLPVAVHALRWSA